MSIFNKIKKNQNHGSVWDEEPFPSPRLLRYAGAAVGGIVAFLFACFGQEIEQRCLLAVLSFAVIFVTWWLIGGIVQAMSEKGKEQSSDRQCWLTWGTAVLVTAGEIFLIASLAMQAGWA